MKISSSAWSRYIRRLRNISDKAASELLAFIEKNGGIDMIERNALIDFAYGLSTKYGEAAAALASEMYDAIAVISEAAVPAALPAETSTIAEVAKAVNGTLKTGNPQIVAESVGRMVKMAGVDTTMHNAIRDGAEWAWIPQGDTCPFCLMLASNGWQRASKKVLKGGHAEHIHANCDCTFAIRFNSDTNVQGYAPRRYERMYDNADGATWQEKLNSMRREEYAKNSKKINEQKRAAYKERRKTEEPIKNRFGQPISWNEKLSGDKWDNSKRILNSLANQFDTKLTDIKPGAHQAAGSVQISGTVMNLSDTHPNTVIHEFAHTISLENQTKFGLYDESDFWKEIHNIQRAYKRDVKDDSSRWISTYEHSSKGADEFMAEAFTLAKLSEMGLFIPNKYGDDLTYANQVLEVIKKYFGK